MPARVTVRSARSSDVAAAARVLGEALDGLPLVRWLVPDSPAHRRRCFAVLVEQAIDTGHAAVAVSARADRPLAVAVWWDVAVRPAGYDRRLLEAVSAVWVERFEALDTAVAGVRPRRGDGFAQVAVWAVRPPMQRRGIGSLLLRHVHAELDATGTGAFQYAVSTAGRDHLCHRYGYESTPEPIPIGARGLVVWPLWRKPNPARR